MTFGKLFKDVIVEEKKFQIGGCYFFVVVIVALNWFLLGPKLRHLISFAFMQTDYL